MATGLGRIATDPANLSRRSESEAPVVSTDSNLDALQLNSGSAAAAQMKRSPLLRNKSKKSVAGTASDSDGSMDSNSLSAESNNEQNHKASSKENTAGTMTTSSTVPSTVPSTGKKIRRGSEWEILEGLKDGQRYDRKPDKYSGFLLKKRKWPLKGWHKRYFLVEKGILIYGKGPADVARGKLHGSLDIGLSVISSKLKRWRIDIDTEEYIYHLKAKSEAVFLKWVEQLKFHRLYRQHLLTFGPGPKDGRLTLTPGRHSPALTLLPLTAPEREKRDSIKCCSPPPVGVGPLINSSAGSGVNTATSGSGPPTAAAGRLAVWMVDVQPTLENVNRELLQVKQSINMLARTLEQIESAHTLDVEQAAAEGSSPNVKKDRKKFGLRKKKCSKGSSMDLTATCSPSKSNVDIDSASPLSTCSLTGLSTSPGSQMNRLSSSNSSLAATPAGCPVPGQSTSGQTAMRPQSLPGPEHLVPLGASSAESSRVSLSCTPDNQLRDDFTALARDVHSCLNGVMQMLMSEKDRLKAALELDSSFMSTPASGIATLPGLRASLSQALQQNHDLRTRLARIHETADISDVTAMERSFWRNHPNFGQKPIHASLSYSSSCLSASEFFDAEEHHDSRESPTDEATGLPFEEAGEGEGEGDAGQLSDTSSEAASLSSEEGSVSSENSEMATEELNAVDHALENKCMTGRRTKLPAPRPDTEGLSLWNLLCKNIGKDLSQVSMPVTLNEPLNMLQRLCEELEYSELLDKAAELSDPLERMIHVAAFTVSSYGSSYFRAGSKPFNPILGETYECVREDKGFRFIAEQVSHHPPISVCYAESRNFIFWQDARIKTKFWGKSMEFQPTGSVSLQLPKWNEVYQWNKVTTCVHNLFGGQRWVDQYGELRITCNTGISCKLTFVKASYWSAKRHEVYGAITDADGKQVRNLFGKWSEALYCGVAPAARCIWRRGTMPEDFERYYGFTRFAVELNELDPETAKYLPCTDTRFRPDQRLLEEGQVSAAEELKMQLEQSQRERRRIKEQEGIQHVPRWFSKKTTPSGEEVWEYNHKYWETRKSPGFVNLSIEKLW